MLLYPRFTGDPLHNPAGDSNRRARFIVCGFVPHFAAAVKPQVNAAYPNSQPTRRDSMPGLMVSHAISFVLLFVHFFTFALRTCTA
jgi:hypothetical protein